MEFFDKPGTAVHAEFLTKITAVDDAVFSLTAKHSASSARGHSHTARSFSISSALLCTPSLA